jgi:hypothetical protein
MPPDWRPAPRFDWGTVPHHVNMVDYSKFAHLGFESFRQMARDPELSRHEKVGFPETYREGKEAAIFADMQAKLPRLQAPGATVLEIGPGCSALPVMLAELRAERGGRVIFVDSAEMLALLPDSPHVSKVAGSFPQALEPQFEALHGRVDVIVAYSVVQYVFTEGNLWDFLDRCLALLADGAEMLLGDIPNQTMRKRYFASAAGERQHREFTQRDEKPQVAFNCLQPGEMDDSVVLALLARARSQGFHAWVLPQASALPMANRREDILIRKP